MKHLKTLRVICLVFLVLLIITECLLRLFNYGVRNDLFVECGDNPNFIQLNTNLEQYDKAFKFSRTIISASKIKREKDAGSIRIFILGPADLTGKPVNPDNYFSHILKQCIDKALPETNVELVNISTDNSSSYTQYKLSKQLRDYGADAVVLCPGSNEFYGEGTIGNNASLNGNIRADRIMAGMMNLRLTQAARQLYAYCFENNSKTPESRRIQSIITGSKVYTKTLDNFEVNLSDMVAVLRDSNIPTILLNNVVNFMDQPPFQSVFSTPDSVRLKQLSDEGEEAYLQGDLNMAFTKLTEVKQKDPGYALSYYYLGKIALADGEKEKARKYFDLAVELDRLKIRPPVAINKIIDKIAAVWDCPVVDADGEFTKLSKSGIPAENLLPDCRHANLAGNIVMARACYQILIREKILKSPAISKDVATLELALTPFDSIYDRLSSSGQKSGIQNETVPSSYEERTASLFSKGRADWEQSMNNLYEYYIRNKNYRSAFKVIENLALENPYNVSIYNTAAKTAAFLGDSQLVVHYAQKVYNLRPDYEVAQQLFLNYLKLDMPENAMPFLQYAQVHRPRKVDLTTIYSTTLEIINLKKLLRSYPSDQDIINQIAAQYQAMGNYEAALKYSVNIKSLYDK